jgi:lipoprotein-anchoring transpeptidase ErfK/SrfK
MKKYSGYIVLGVVVVLVAISYSFTVWHSQIIQSLLPPHSSSSTSGAPVSPATTNPAIPPLVIATSSLFQYVEVVDSCGPYFGGTCLNMRSGPGVEYPSVGKLRNGMVLKVATTTWENGSAWYQIGFDGVIHYPERVTNNWYVAADYVQSFYNAGPSSTASGINRSSTKRIVINLTKEMLYAYEGDAIFMEQPISTGLELTPTPAGTFWIFRKTPDSYLQGPIIGVSDQYYDLPGVPWDLYFTTDGGAIHGAYWHDHFGQPWSHGCVNLPPDQAKTLYAWADLGTPVIVER